MTWYSVDLPEAIAVRERLLPEEEHITTISRSALDWAWMEEVPQHKPAFIVMAGLLMYFEEQQVFDLLKRVAERFPGGSEIFFDVIPPWLSNKSMKGWAVTETYTVPPAPWGMQYGDCVRIEALHPAYRIKKKMTYADPFPRRMLVYYLLSRIKWIADKMAPWMIHLEIRK